MKEFFSNNEYFSANILLNGEILPFTFHIVEHILGLPISTWNKARK